jgi:short-subunit dehydrogenase
MSMLVLAAGVGTASGVEDATIRRTEKTFRVNYFARLRLIQLCLPQLREVALRRPKVGSRIVGLSSITGQFPEPKLAVYGSSKAALMSLLETVNAEESGRGVMATAIAPAYVATDMSAWVSDKIPIETMIPASDIATLVRMIARLDKRTSIPRLVVSRSGTASHEA